MPYDSGRGKRGDVHVYSRMSSFDGDPYLPHSGALFPGVLSMCFMKHVDLKFNSYEMNHIIEDTFFIIKDIIGKVTVNVVGSLHTCVSFLLRPFGLASVFRICRGGWAGLWVPLVACWC